MKIDYTSPNQPPLINLKSLIARDRVVSTLGEEEFQTSKIDNFS